MTSAENGGDGRHGGKDEEEKEGALLSMRQVRLWKCLPGFRYCYAEMRRALVRWHERKDG